MSKELKERAAALLSIEPDEVHDVVEAEDDVLFVKTSDGQTYIVVPEDDPDDEGKYGVMYLVPPSPNYGGTFPVYRKANFDPVAAAIAGADNFAAAVQAVRQLEDLEDETVEELGADRPLDEPPPKPGPTEEASARALATETGASSEPAPAPGPEHAEDVVDSTTPPGEKAVDDAVEQAETAGDPVPAKKAARAQGAAKRSRQA